MCALIRHGKQLCVAWCGDSAAAVLREDSVRTLSSAHSPDVPVFLIESLLSYAKHRTNHTHVFIN